MVRQLYIIQDPATGGGAYRISGNNNGGGAQSPYASAIELSGLTNAQLNEMLAGVVDSIIPSAKVYGFEPAPENPQSFIAARVIRPLAKAEAIQFLSIDV
ncbi:MAG: hypothetical protein ACU84J_07905, partial [Gammaproteobacteria bacterium]